MSDFKPGDRVRIRPANDPIWQQSDMNHLDYRWKGRAGRIRRTEGDSAIVDVDPVNPSLLPESRYLPTKGLERL